MAETKTIDLGPTGHTVRRNVARLRKAQGLSYAELSRNLEERGRPIPALGLRRIEAAQRRVDADDLVALAIALQTTPNMLLFPPLRGRTVWGRVTGVEGEVQTAQTWVWAGGNAPIRGFDTEAEPYPFPGTGSTLQPLDVLTPAERRYRRKSWRDSQVDEYEDTLEKVAEGLTWDDPETGLRVSSPEYEAYARAEIERLKALDPADESTWASIPDDPGRVWAPPAELLEGLRFDD